MSGGNGGSGKLKKKSVSKMTKAGLYFLVGRLARYLKKGRYAQRIGFVAPVYLVVVLEYLAGKVLDLSRNATRDNKKSHINPHHIQLIVRTDEELGKLLSRVNISYRGVLSNIHDDLLPKNSSFASSPRGEEKPKKVPKSPSKNTKAKE